MKANELRAMSDKDLTKELGELMREQFNLRMQMATGQLSNNAQVRKVRRDIARVRTIMNEKARVSS
jgi:large subunit ribosomal protein L29